MIDFSNIDQEEFQNLINTKNKLDEEFQRVLPNKKFNKYTCEAKKEWYAKHLKYRISKKYLFDFYNSMDKICCQFLPKYISNQISRFCSVQKLGRGKGFL